MSINQRRWSRFGLLFLAAILIYALITFLAWVLGAIVVKEFPENYEWQVKTALKNGNFTKAERIARERVEAEHYDFGAHRLLARVLLEDKKTSEAVSTLLMSLDRLNAASGRDVYTRGADPSATYELLNKALQEQQRYSYAAEAARIAEDYRAMSIVATSESTPVSIMKQTSTNPSFEDAQELNLQQFQLSQGVSFSTSGTLYFSNNGKATAAFEEIKGRPSQLLINVRGSKALGLGSILTVNQGEHELIRVYAPDKTARWLTVPLDKFQDSSTLRLTLTFINDGFDPVTKSDRNVEVLRLLVR